MKVTVLSFVIAAVLMIPALGTAADINDVAGTWSGNWTPKGGVIDALTVEIKVENGKISGKFRTPVLMDFTRATYDPKTGAVAFEATDAKAGQVYKINGKLAGNDIKGTMQVGTAAGDVLLIKWTYIPR
jgi:hypothetical protein